MTTRELKTEYGILKGAARADYWESGALKECLLTEPNQIDTPYGRLTPQYSEDGVRRKFTSSLAFYQSGGLKSISLHDSHAIPTPLGPLPAELLTFYQSGKLKRLFPLNGKITGFWSERNEYKLAPLLTLPLPFGIRDIKPLSLYFYETGELKSLTVWPYERLVVPTGAGMIETSIGAAFFRSGRVRSVEPLAPTLVHTPIGALTAFDDETTGLCADRNSLCFDETGALASLKTNRDCITVDAPGRGARVYSPKLAMSHFSDDRMRAVPMAIVFANGAVSIDGDRYLFREHSFSAAAFRPRGATVNDGCSGCG